MPQVIGLMLIGAGVWAGYKALSQAVARIAADLASSDEDARRQQERAARRAEKDLGTLVYDPESGVYRPQNAKGA
jgi:hypothetical protein